MKSLKRDISDLERFEEIVSIIVREESGYILDRLDLEDRLPIVKQVTAKRQTKPSPERLRETIEELGTTFIKFGQIMAERPDIIPVKYTEELSKLQDSAPPFESETAMEMIEEDVGMEKFLEVEEEPIAAASVAQVHRATLENGDDVVVKIRRPDVKQKVNEDLDILKFFAKEAEKHSEKAASIKARKLVREFSRWTKNELDLRKEAQNAQVFKNNLEREEKLYVPEVYPELTSERVLVMEYVDGVKCTNKEALEAIDVDSEKLATTAVRAGMKQVISDGFFHADPHPSNFLISEDGTLIYLDFGMMGEIPKNLRDKIALLLIHTMKENSEKAMDILQDIGHTEQDANLERIEEEINYKIMRLKNSSIGDASISRELLDLIVVCGENGLHLPTSMTLMGKNLLTMEGIGLTICPDFKPGDEYETYGKKLLKQNNKPEDLKNEFMLDIFENRDMITRPLSKLKQTMKQDSGETTVVKQESSSYLPLLLAMSGMVLIASNPNSDQMIYAGLAAAGLASYIFLRQN